MGSVCLFFMLLANTSCNLRAVPADRIIENISLSEAQEFAPFKLCLPSYIPNDVDKEPKITFMADWGDSHEARVKMLFYWSKSEEIAFEYNQKNIPGVNSFEDTRSDSSLESSIRSLIAWLVSEPTDIENVLNQLLTTAVAYQEYDTTWWLITIDNPLEFRANMVEWLKNPVYYTIYSRLPSEEITLITQSVLSNCKTNNIPTQNPP